MCLVSRRASGSLLGLHHRSSLCQKTNRYEWKFEAFLLVSLNLLSHFFKVEVHSISRQYWLASIFIYLVG